MAEICPDCERPFATDAHEQTLATHCANGSLSPSCNHFTIARLRRELATARAVGELERKVIEGYALQNDALEREARACGAFDAAVCYQQFSSWLRSGQLCARISGTECRMVIGTTSNELVMLRGDIADETATFAVGMASVRLSDALLAARAATAEPKEPT